MKYIYKNKENILVFKLNDTTTNTYSGTYLLQFKHIQSSSLINLTLSDVSLIPNVFQKFIISTEDSLDFQIGQYSLNIYDASASTKSIFFENITVLNELIGNIITFMPTSDESVIFNSSGTTFNSIPDSPNDFSASLLANGSDVRLTWSLGSTNTDNFEIWRKESGSTYIAIGLNVQSFIYFDRFLNLNTEYNYKIRAKNNLGYSDFSPEIVLQTAAISGVTGVTSNYYTKAEIDAFLSGISSGITYNFIGSGATQVIKNNSDVTIFSPLLNWLNISNKPSFFSGEYNDLNNKPILFNGSYSGLTDKPDLSIYGLKINSITGGTSLGNGTGIFTSILNNNLQFKSLKVLGGLSISSDSSSITISGGSGNIPSGATPTLTFSGSGTTVVNTIKNNNDYLINIFSPSGTSGTNGIDGYTPIKGVDYSDGINGIDGNDGASGATPTLNFVGSGATIVNTIKNINDYTIHIFSPSGATGSDGIDGYTPQKNIDYFDGADGYTPVKGIDYNDGNQGDTGLSGYTPQFGIDYHNGVDGASGLTPTLSFSGSGSTIVNTIKNGTTYQINIYAPSGATGGKGDKGDQGISGTSYNATVFNLYTGNTATDIGNRLLINNFNIYSGITANLFNTKSNTGHTHSNYALQVDINILSGTTIPNLYYNKTQINAYTGDTNTLISNRLLTSAFNIYSGNTATAIGLKLNSSSISAWALESVKPSYTKTEIGLGSVDNTADSAKSVLYAATAGAAPASDVSAWAKAATKPSYSAAEVGALATAATAADSSKLGNVAASSYQLKSAIATYTGTTAPLQFASKTVAITGATNLGTGQAVYTSVASNKVQLKGLKVLGSLAISNDSTSITLSGASVTVTGATTDIFANVTDGQALARSGSAIVGVPYMHLLKKTANQTINSGAATFVDISDLTFSVVSGQSYAFFFYITFQSAAATTGWRASVNAPNGTLDFWAQSDNIANGAAGVATHTERHNTVRDDMTLLTATVTQAVDLAVRIEGRYLSTQSGTFAARFANELNSNTDIVVQKGSYGWWF
jgi:hypothetical protein